MRLVLVRSIASRPLELRAPTTISTALDEGEDTIVVASAAGLTVGKWVLISNTEQPIPGMTRTDRVKGEMALISAINGTTITLDSGLYFAYGTAGLKLEPLTTVDDVEVICKSSWWCWHYITVLLYAMEPMCFLINSRSMVLKKLQLALKR
jgi:hypothetical protein